MGQRSSRSWKHIRQWSSYFCQEVSYLCFFLWIMVDCCIFVYSLSVWKHTWCLVSSTSIGMSKNTIISKPWNRRVNIILMTFWRIMYLYALSFNSNLACHWPRHFRIEVKYSTINLLERLYVDVLSFIANLLCHGLVHHRKRSWTFMMCLYLWQNINFVCIQCSGWLLEIDGSDLDEVCASTFACLMLLYNLILHFYREKGNYIHMFWVNLHHFKFADRHK